MVQEQGNVMLISYIKIVDKDTKKIVKHFRDSQPVNNTEKGIKTNDDK